MKADGTVIIDTRIDTKGVDTGISTMKSQFGKLGSTIRKIGAIVGAAFAVKQLVQFGKEAIQLGSDLAEVQNVVDVTFGSLSGEVDAFAKNAVTQFGLSELSAKQFTSTMGAMLKSMGFTERAAADMGMSIAGLAGDIASFYNLGTEEAFYKIRSGISGETEPLKQLGINMSVANLEQYAFTQGITKSYNAMTQQEQALLRYNYLLSVTSDAQGDFSRTSESWANQTRILSEQFNSLKATIGQGLINAFTPVIRVINTVLAGLQAVANVFRQVTALLFGKAASGGTTQKALEGVADGYGAAAEGAEDLAKGTKEAGEAAKKSFAPFDEITRLSEEAATGGGGSGAGGGYGGGMDLGIPSFGSEPIEDTISPQIQAIVDKILYLIEPLRNIDFTPLRESLANLGGKFRELGATIGDALEWAWFNILVPLATWAIEDLAPATVDLLSSALGLLNDVLEALQPFGQWLWDNFLQPIAEWTGGVIVDVLTDVSNCLKKIGDWVKGHKEAVENIAIVVASFAAAWELVNAAVLVWNAISGLATVLTTGFGAAVAFLTSPITLVTLAIGALIAIVVLLVKNWDTVKETAAKVWDKIKEVWHSAGEWFGGVVDEIFGAFAGLRDKVVGIWDSIVGAVRDAVDKIMSWFGKVGSGSASFSVSAGGTSRAADVPTAYAAVPATVPYLAKGAVIPPKSPFMAVLGDQKSGYNIEAPESAIREQAMLALKDFFAKVDLGGGDITIKFTGDLAQLARVLTPEITRQTRKNNRALGI